MNKVLLKVWEDDIVFHLDIKNKKLLKVEAKAPDMVKYVIPGAMEDNFNYLRLENIMKYYMNMEDSKYTLEDVLKKIQKDGFLYMTNPSLRMYVEEVDG